MSRYSVEKRRGFERAGMLVIRARLTDEQTGAVADFRKRDLVVEAAELLDRDDKGKHPPRLEDPSPFPSYESRQYQKGGVFFIVPGDGPFTTSAVAVSRDEKFATRIARVLAQAHARPRRPWRGRYRFGWF